MWGCALCDVSEGVVSKQTAITKSANGQPCIRCGNEDGTICARHYNGLRQHSYGKGRGIKCHDIITAELCNSCDALFTEGVNHTHDGERAGKSIHRSEAFQHLILLTIISRLERGDLKV